MTSIPDMSPAHSVAAYLTQGIPPGAGDGILVTSPAVRRADHVDENRAAELLEVTLVRMEGVLHGIDYKVGDLIARMTKTETDVNALRSLTQSLAQNADAEEAKKIALALALKEADATRRIASESSWSPVAKVITVIVSLAAVAGIVLQYLASHH